MKRFSLNLYELFIGFRYLKSKKGQGFISFNTVLSMIIVFLGVFILIVVISVMNGFQSQIKDKILDVDSHISVTNGYGNPNGDSMVNYRRLIEKIKTIPGVTAVDPYVQGEALLRHRTNISYVMIRGTGTKKNIPKDVMKFLHEGKEDFTRKRGIFIGAEMAVNNGISRGDYIEIIVPKGRLSAREGMTPGMQKYKVLGFFKTGYYDFDTKLIIMDFKQAQRLYEVGNVARGIGVKIRDVYSELEVVASRIRSAVSFDYNVRTAADRNRNLFYALQLEKLIMTIILFLVILSAAFSIMGTLVMVVMEKKKAIGVLKSMGAKPNSIMIIFILEGFLIGVAGTVMGVLMGLAAALNLEAIIKWIEATINSVGMKVHMLFSMAPWEQISLVPKHVYYIDSIPTVVKPEFVVFIAVFAVFLSTVASIFPAWHASRQKPVDTIRYE